MAHEIPGMRGATYIIGNAESHGASHLGALQEGLVHLGGWVIVAKEGAATDQRPEELQQVELFFPHTLTAKDVCDALRDHLDAKVATIVAIPRPLPPTRPATAPAAT